MQRIALLLLAVLDVVDAHPQPVKDEEGCTCEAGAKAFESYHIHVLFYPDLATNTQFSNNTHASQFARSLRKTFIEHFNAPQCEDNRPIGNQTSLCAYPVDEMGSGYEINTAPFVTPNWAVFVPVNRYADTVPWMMANRGDLDFLVHPNSCGYTCAPEDHLLWSVWGGNKWPVRFVLPEARRPESRTAKAGQAAGSMVV